MNNQSLLQQFSDYLLRRNYSKATQKSYLSTLKCFLNYQSNHGNHDITEEEIKSYITYRFKQGVVWSTVNCDYSSLKLFYCHVLNKEWKDFLLQRPRGEKPLSVIISRQSVVKLIESASNYKYQVFFSLVYATGLRLNEAIQLRIEDVDGERKKIHVRRGKGAKDRYVDIAQPILVLLREYYIAYRPFLYLFNGYIPGHPISPRTIQHAMKKAVKKAGIRKKVTFHTLRHCYGTHHLESGTDLIYIKNQMGHSNLKTTSRYLHLCKDYPRQINHPIADMSIRYRTNL